MNLIKWNTKIWNVILNNITDHHFKSSFQNVANKMILNAVLSVAVCAQPQRLNKTSVPEDSHSGAQWIQVTQPQNVRFRNVGLWSTDLGKLAPVDDPGLRLGWWPSLRKKLPGNTRKRFELQNGRVRVCFKCKRRDFDQEKQQEPDAWNGEIVALAFSSRETSTAPQSVDLNFTKTTWFFSSFYCCLTQNNFLSNINLGNHHDVLAGC